MIGTIIAVGIVGLLFIVERLIVLQIPKVISVTYDPAAKWAYQADVLCGRFRPKIRVALSHAGMYWQWADTGSHADLGIDGEAWVEVEQRQVKQRQRKKELDSIRWN